MAPLPIRSTVTPGAAAGLVAVALGVATIVGVGPDARPALVAAAVVVASAGFALVLFALRTGGGLPVRLVLASGAVLTALCVTLPPAGSKDVASYALYGRMVTVYRENPYSSVPDDHPDDPWYPEVSLRWRQTPSVYGPAFTVLSAAVTKVGGRNRTAVRLGFQGVAGLALLAAAVTVARLTASPAATAFVALNPLLLASVVNGAHNDALVGAALLGACLAARRRWWVAAGTLVAVAAGVKVAAVLAVPALAAWAWRHYGRRAGATVAATAGALLAVGHLAFGPVAVGRALAEAGQQSSRSSVWRLAFDNGPHRLVGLLAITASVALGALLARRHLAAPGPEAAVAGALVGYLLLGSYVLPWYHAWVLLPVAVAWRSRLALGAVAASTVLLLGYTWPAGDHSAVGLVLRAISYWVAPAVALAVAAALVSEARASRRSSRRASEAVQVPDIVF